MNSRRLLYVSYPLLPVSEASAGGAEQVLRVLEREMHLRGHHTAVAASQGSQIAGRLVATGEPATGLDQYPQREAEQARAVLEHLDAEAYDLVHDMSGSFWRFAAQVRAPVLATLHLPRSFYDPALFGDIPSNVFFHCVSESQRRTFSDLPDMAGVVENGISLERFEASPRERTYLLWLGRICEEKGTHIALDVAHSLAMPIVIAGAVYPFLYHRQYFAREIVPRFKRAGRNVRYVTAPSFGEKVDLLHGARALLIPSLAAETSSLVAMEAAACGTPVIAFANGALPEVVAEGETGFIAKDANEMAAAVRRIDHIDPLRCIAVAQRRFSAKRMADDYERLYGEALSRQHSAFSPGTVSERI